MNIIFLDIDGVFSSPRSFVGSKEKKSGRRAEFDPIAMELINKLCERTNSKIVISSTWRRFSRMEPGNGDQHSLYNNLKSGGLIKHIFFPSWATVCLDGNRPADFPSIKKFISIIKHDHDRYVRGDEINHWMKCNGQNVKNYCILDDDGDFTDDQIKHNLVQTNGQEGMLYKDFVKAEKILSKDS